MRAQTNTAEFDRPSKAGSQPVNRPMRPREFGLGVPRKIAFRRMVRVDRSRLHVRPTENARDPNAYARTETNASRTAARGQLAKSKSEQRVLGSLQQRRTPLLDSCQRRSQRIARVARHACDRLDASGAELARDHVGDDLFRRIAAACHTPLDPGWRVLVNLEFGPCRLRQDDAARLADAQRRLRTLAMERFFQGEFMRRKPRDQLAKLIGEFAQAMRHFVVPAPETQHATFDRTQPIRAASGPDDVARAHCQRRRTSVCRPALEKQVKATKTHDLGARVDAEDPDCRHARMVAVPRATS